MDRLRRVSLPGIVLGIGLGGFVDGIVLHQALQWHHMLSDTSEHPTNTVAGLEANTLADGLFHMAAWVAVAAGVWLLWRAAARGAMPDGRRLISSMVLGWGLFNVVEGTVNHFLLGLHHVREGSNETVFDLAFFGVSALMLVAGWAIGISGGRRISDGSPTTKRLVTAAKR
jgi:uncharacterized membrane protein